MNEQQDIDIAIVGSGFSGLAMATPAEALGPRRLRHPASGRARSAAPGARTPTRAVAATCPATSTRSRSRPNPDWSSTFSAQPEIRDYLRRVAAEEGLLEHVRFGCEVESARWDADGAALACCETSSGPLRGPGADRRRRPAARAEAARHPGPAPTSRGRSFTRPTWDHDHDLEGERVAVIGTGASAIQFVPQIQPRVAKLHLFQRTRAVGDAAPRPAASPASSASPTGASRRCSGVARASIYWAREAIAIPMLRVALAPLLRRVGQAHLRRQVPDPELRAKLTPDYLPGCKRILVANDYLPVARASRTSRSSPTGSPRSAGARSWAPTAPSARSTRSSSAPASTCSTCRSPSASATARGARWPSTGTAARRPTAARWSPASRTCSSCSGPNTGLGHNSVVYMAEAQADYVLQALAHMRERRPRDARRRPPEAAAALERRRSSAG